MRRSILCIIAIAIALPLCAADVPKPGISTMQSLTVTCKSPNPGGVFRQADGGYIETPQGWFIRAEVHGGGTGWPAAYCFYGSNKALAASSEAYSVHYELKGFQASQCAVSGQTVKCTLLPVLKP